MLTINEVYVAIMEQFPYSSSDTAECRQPASEHVPASNETWVDFHASSLGTAEVGRARADIEAATVEPSEVISRHEVEVVTEVGRWLTELRKRAILEQEPHNEEPPSDYTLAA